MPFNGLANGTNTGLSAVCSQAISVTHNDLTFSSGPGGEQSTVVMGQGKSPELRDLRKFGEQAGFNREKYGLIIEQTRDALSHLKTLAKSLAVSTQNISLIGKRIQI